MRDNIVTGIFLLIPTAVFLLFRKRLERSQTAV